MKTKKVLPLISLLFVAIMLLSVGMIAKEYRERQQDIKGFEKLADIITEVEQTEMADNVEQTEIPQEQKQSSRNLTPLFEANGDCIGWICIPNTAVNYPVMFTPEEPQKYLRKNFEGEYSVSGVPFLDGASTPECDNLIIYGHNMKNGTMFSDITQYRDIQNQIGDIPRGIWPHKVQVKHCDFFKFPLGGFRNHKVSHADKSPPAVFWIPPAYRWGCLPAGLPLPPFVDTPHRIIWRKPPQMVGIWENGKKIYKIYMEDISRLFPLPSTRREQTQMCMYCGRNQRGGKGEADILADLSNTDAEPGNCS